MTVWRGCWVLALLLAAGCVTTERGPGPKVAPDAERVQAQLGLARGYLEKGEWARARQPLERALELDSRSADAHGLLALLFQEEGERTLAEKEYKTALRYDPANAQTLNNYGSFLFGLGRYEEARDHLQRAVRDTAYSRRAMAYENLGSTELRLLRIDEAEKSFKRALSLNSSLRRANLELAEIYFDRGDNTLAQRHYKGYLAVAPQTPRSLWIGIRLARVFDRKDELASYALALRNLYPGSEEYRLYRESLE